MFHELTHASLDWWWGGSVNEEKWLNAVNTDKYYISEYAWELPGNEDLKLYYGGMHQGVK